MTQKTGAEAPDTHNRYLRNSEADGRGGGSIGQRKRQTGYALCQEKLASRRGASAPSAVSLQRQGSGIAWDAGFSRPSVVASRRSTSLGILDVAHVWRGARDRDGPWPRFRADLSPSVAVLICSRLRPCCPHGPLCGSRRDATPSGSRGGRPWRRRAQVRTRHGAAAVQPGACPRPDPPQAGVAQRSHLPSERGAYAAAESAPPLGFLQQQCSG